MNNHSQIPSIIELPPFKHPDDLPILFDEINTPDIPASLLPEVFGEFANALATATETAPALSVMVILGVISTCVAKRFVISPQEGWFEPINIYTLIALPPANHKSFVLTRCTQPLIQWEAEQAKLLDKEIKQQSSQRKSQEKWIECLRIRAAKEVDREKQSALFAEIAELEANLVESAVLPQLFANDATPESLAYSTFEQGGRFAIFSDEGGILETLAGLYSHGATNIDIILKGIDGGEMRIRRKDRSFNLNPYLTLVLAVQPAVLHQLCEKRAYCGNGALERFLYVLPKSRLGYRTHDRTPVNNALQDAYNAEVISLLNIAPLIVNNSEQARVLTFSPEALLQWQQFRLAIEPQLRPTGTLASCIGWGGKICGFALRIAGLLHVANNTVDNLIVAPETMQNGLTIANLLMEHAIAAFNVFSADQAIEDAKEVFNWIKAQGKNFFTQTEIISVLRNRKLGKSDRLHKALRVLIERNILSVQRIPTPRKSTIEYFVHPTIFNS